MKEQFVTYEIALKLKELGFDEKCFGYYSQNDTNDMHYLGIYQEEDYFLSGDVPSIVGPEAPLWQQAIDWLRKEYDIVVEINHGLTLDVIPTFYYSIWKMNGASEYQSDCNYTILKFEEARKQGILKGIELKEK